MIMVLNVNYARLKSMWREIHLDYWSSQKDWRNERKRLQVQALVDLSCTCHTGMVEETFIAVKRLTLSQFHSMMIVKYSILMFMQLFACKQTCMQATNTGFNWSTMHFSMIVFRAVPSWRQGMMWICRNQTIQNLHWMQFVIAKSHYLFYNSHQHVIIFV